jgi:hypothetical protein
VGGTAVPSPVAVSAECYDWSILIAQIVEENSTSSEQVSTTAGHLGGPPSSRPSWISSGFLPVV